jgi:hypothetical protein
MCYKKLLEDTSLTKLYANVGRYHCGKTLSDTSLVASTNVYIARFRFPLYSTSKRASIGAQGFNSIFGNSGASRGYSCPPCLSLPEFRLST